MNPPPTMPHLNQLHQIPLPDPNPNHNLVTNLQPHPKHTVFKTKKLIKGLPRNNILIPFDIEGKCKVFTTKPLV